MAVSIVGIKSFLLETKWNIITNVEIIRYFPYTLLAEYRFWDAAAYGKKECFSDGESAYLLLLEKMKLCNSRKVFCEGKNVQNGQPR